MTLNRVEQYDGMPKIFVYFYVGNLPKLTKLSQFFSPSNSKYMLNKLHLLRQAHVLRRYLFVRFSRSIATINPLTNERKIAFASQILPDRDEVKIYETDYFSGLCTYRLTIYDLKWENNDTARSAVENCNFRMDTDEKNATALYPLGEQRRAYSSEGGIQMLAVTKDGFLKLAVQSKWAQISQDTRTPTASGGIDWSDQLGCKTLKQVLLNAARRELIEEQGRAHSKIPLKIIRAYPIGFFRMPHQGGKPEFVVFASLDNAASELFPDTAEVIRGEDLPAQNMDVLKGSIVKILESKTPKTNFVPLIGALICLQHALEQCPQLVMKVGFPSSTK
jgi:hypothetical protein